jgi:hypothetical protein
MRRYIIVKSSRLSNEPYAGPACQRAGVKPGQVFRNRGAARRVAKKLNAVNPAGFCVREQMTAEAWTDEVARRCGEHSATRGRA